MNDVDNNNMGNSSTEYLPDILWQLHTAGHSGHPANRNQHQTACKRTTLRQLHRVIKRDLTIYNTGQDAEYGSVYM